MLMIELFFTYFRELSLRFLQFNPFCANSTSFYIHIVTRPLRILLSGHIDAPTLSLMSPTLLVSPRTPCYQLQHIPHHSKREPDSLVYPLFWAFILLGRPPCSDPITRLYLFGRSVLTTNSISLLPRFSVCATLPCLHRVDFSFSESKDHRSPSSLPLHSDRVQEAFFYNQGR